MSTKVMQCTQCGMYYNAADYEQCPYCANGVVKNVKKEGKKPKTHWPWKNDSKTSESSKSEKTQENGKAEQLWTESKSDEAATHKTGTHNGGMMQSGNSDKHQNSSEALDTPAKSDMTNVPATSGVTVSYWDGNAMSAATEKQTQTVETTFSTSIQPEKKETESWVSPLSGNQPQPADIPFRVQSVGKTTAKYMSVSNGVTTYPVVGWLVCVKGIYHGTSFPLKTGRNRVGRDKTLEISLPKDDSVSSQSVVVLIYDSKGNEFSAMPGESNSSLCYINGEAIYERYRLKGFEEIELGDSENNKFLFVPLCGENFQWSSYPNESKHS